MGHSSYLLQVLHSAAYFKLGNIKLKIKKNCSIGYCALRLTKRLPVQMRFIFFSYLYAEARYISRVALAWGFVGIGGLIVANSAPGLRDRGGQPGATIGDV